MRSMSRDAAGTASRRWAFVLILSLFLVLAVVYNVVTPIYESPDELQHAAFVVWLARGHPLPVVRPEDPGPWAQEGTQPPLYYWLVAQSVGRLSRGEATASEAVLRTDLAELNPYAGIGDPQRPDNKNRVLHDLEQEGWPYRGNVLFVHLTRCLSTLLAAGALVAIYRLGRLLFPDRPGMALAMAGLVAFIPQFVFLSASINNDNLVIPIASWVVVILVSWLRAPQLPGWPSLAGVGLLLGLGALAKFSGLLLWPLAAGTMLWLAVREKRFRWLIPAGLLVFGLAAALSGWWFVRNQRLYGDFSGLGAHLAIVGTRARLPHRLSAWLAEFRGLRYSFWALFGWFDILAPDPFYWIMDGLAALGVVGLAVFTIRSFRLRPPWIRQAVLLAFTWLGLVAVAFVRWTVLTPASQGRLLFPALAAIALFLVLGWDALLPQRIRRPAGVAALAAWAAWAGLCPFLLIGPAYALPQRVQALSELDVALSALHVQYGGCCELVGYSLPEAPLHPGDRVPLTLVWRASQAMDENYALFVHAETTDGQVVGQLDTYHGGGMYPSSQWQPGEIVVDTAYVPLSLKAEAPALIRFNVGLHGMPGPERLAAFSADGEELDAVFAGEAALTPFQWPAPQPDLGVDAVFGGQIRLVGVEPGQATAQPGQAVTVTLQWEALDRITEDYVGFIHLADPQGIDVAQDDHEPMNGRFPTRLWFAGSAVIDAYRLQLPTGLEAGTYEVWAGFYRPESGQRLRAESQRTGERWRDDLVHVGSLTVAPDGQ
jgi:4-amino-4-deoxy-L-arabinose transferase-like glycosyltransferase